MLPVILLCAINKYGEVSLYTNLLRKPSVIWMISNSLQDPELRRDETKKILDWYVQTSSIHDCSRQENTCSIVKFLQNHVNLILLH